jgi:zinc transport system ATP-binding protein
MGRLLEIDHITIAYGPTVAVSDVSVGVADGEFVVVTGSNGSGKSSLLRCVLGLVRTTSGTIGLDGVVARTSAQWRERRRLAAYVPQRTTPGTFPLLVHELLASSGSDDAAIDAASRLGIADLVERPLTTLSGGQLQRAYLARAVGSIAAGARLLLADEPTSALDFAGQDDVALLLHELSVDRLVVSHDAAVVGKADRVLEMAGGTLRERAA